MPGTRYKHMLGRGGGGDGCMLVLLIALMLPLGLVGLSGCAPTSAKRIDQLEQAIVFYESKAGVVDTSIADAKALAIAASLEFKKARATDDTELIAQAQALMDDFALKVLRLEERKAEVDAIVAGTREKITSIRESGQEITLSDNIEAFVPIATGIAQYIPPPWGQVVTLGLLGLAQGLRVREGRAFKQVVSGGNAVIETAAEGGTVLTGEEIIQIMRGEHTSATEALVKKTKKKLADELIR